MVVPYSKGRRDAKMTDAGDFQPSGTTDSATERGRGGEKLAAKSRGFFADQRIADCHSLARSLEFVAISLQFEVLSRTERLLLALRKGNRNYPQTSETIS